MSPPEPRVGLASPGWGLLRSPASHLLTPPPWRPRRLRWPAPHIHVIIKLLPRITYIRCDTQFSFLAWSDGGAQEEAGGMRVLVPLAQSPSGVRASVAEEQNRHQGPHRHAVVTRAASRSPPPPVCPRAGPLPWSLWATLSGSPPPLRSPSRTVGASPAALGLRADPETSSGRERRENAVRNCGVVATARPEGE